MMRPGDSIMRSIERGGILGCTPFPSGSTTLWLLVAGLLLAVGLGDGYECGGFVEVTGGSSGHIQSPGYPGNYPNYTRCIWILEAPNFHVPRLTVDFVGEMYASDCADFVEIRDGGPSGELIVRNCATMTSQVVTSTSRWMYVFFASDGLNQVDGLSASYTAVHVGSSINASIPNPVGGCRSYEFKCRNNLCLSMSYRCDGFYDCGCGADCDEDGCEGLAIDKHSRMAIGFAVGISVFIVAAALGLLLEKRHNWEKEKGSADDGGNQASTRRHRWPSAKDNKISAGEASKPSPLAIRVSEVV